MTSFTIVVLVTAARPPGARADDPVVHLDPDLQQFDRRLPSSQAFVLAVAVPGKEVVRGQLDVWPLAGNDDCTQSPRSEKQHHRLALVVDGSEASRTLKATVPPLQVDTGFCFAVQIIRGLDEVQAVGFAAQVTDRVFPTVAGGANPATLDLTTTCARPDRRDQFEQALGVAIADVSRRRVGNEQSRLEGATLALRPSAFVGTPAPAPAPAADVRAPAPAPAPAADEERWIRPIVVPAIDDAERRSGASAIARIVLDGLALEPLCAAVGAAQQDARTAGTVANGANDDVLAAMARFPALVAGSPVTARMPLFVSGTPLAVRRYDQLLPQDAAIPAAAVELEASHLAIAALLHDLENAKAETRAAAYKAYQDQLKTLAPGPVELVYLSGGIPTRGGFDVLFPVKGATEAESDWRRRQAVAQTLVQGNLDLLKRQMAALEADDRDAAAWLDALVALEGPLQASQSARAARDAKEAALATARQAVIDAVKNRLLASDVRGEVVNVTAVRALHRMRAVQSDEGASAVSADVGVLVAFPFHVEADVDGWAPWVLPYAGVNIYGRRVDRVVPFDELVGSCFWHRVSLTLGALLTRPKLNGASISMPFRDSGLVPVVAVGLRLTSFTRASIGGFAFDYQDPNPASTAKHRAGAVWLGLSIDADVWSVAAGKAFK